MHSLPCRVSGLRIELYHQSISKQIHKIKRWQTNRKWDLFVGPCAWASSLHLPHTHKLRGWDHGSDLHSNPFTWAPAVFSAHNKHECLILSLALLIVTSDGRLLWQGRQSSASYSSRVFIARLPLDSFGYMTYCIGLQVGWLQINLSVTFFAN